LLVPRVNQPESFAKFLEHRLNVTPELEAGRLSAERIADVALLAGAHAPAYAATARLVSLMASLPLPSDESRDFWFQLWQAADDPVAMPANLRGQLLRAMDGDGAGLADQLLTLVAEMSTEQRLAAAEVIGTAIGTNHFSGYKDGYVGELWLREVESAAWQVLHAYCGRRTWEEQQEFVRAWRNA
jgi:hypothetical protein